MGLANLGQLRIPEHRRSAAPHDPHQVKSACPLSPIPTLLVFDEFCWETSSMSFRAALKRRAWSSPSLSLSLSLSPSVWPVLEGRSKLLEWEHDFRLSRMS